MVNIKQYGDSFEYYNKFGKLHREDGPAVEYLNGTNMWFIDGKLHREDGPAIEMRQYAAWYINGNRHREDGPAVEWGDGVKEWWIDGKLHRVDGPAVERVDGEREWWIDGIQVTKGDIDLLQFIKND